MALVTTSAAGVSRVWHLICHRAERLGPCAKRRVGRNDFETRVHDFLLRGAELVRSDEFEKRYD